MALIHQAGVVAPAIKKNPMKTKIKLSDFSFRPAGYGCYLVSYCSPATGRVWQARVTDMTLIDRTKNAEDPRRCDLEMLKWFCKNK